MVLVVATSSSAAGASIPVALEELVIPVFLEPFFQKLEEANRESVEKIFDTRELYEFLRLAKLLSATALAALVNNNTLNTKFLDGDAAMKFDFGDTMSRAVWLGIISEVVQARKGIAMSTSSNAALQLPHTGSSSSSNSSSTSGSRGLLTSGSEGTSNALGKYVGQAEDLDGNLHTSSERVGMPSRMLELQAMIRMMEEDRFQILSQHKRFLLEVDFISLEWANHHMEALSGGTTPIFERAVLYRQLMGALVLTDVEKLKRFMMFSFHPLNIYLLNVSDFNRGGVPAWTFDFKSPAKVTGEFKVYFGGCLGDLFEIITFVYGPLYEPLKTLAIAPFNGIGFVHHYPDLILYIKYHQLLATLSKLLNYTPGSLTRPLNGPKFVVAEITKLLTDINKFPDPLSSINMSTWTNHIIPSYVITPPPKRGREPNPSGLSLEPIDDKDAGGGSRKKSRAERKAVKKATESRGVSRIVQQVVSSSSEASTLLASPRADDSGYCPWNLAGLIGVIDGKSKTSVTCTKDGCKRSHATTPDSVTNDEAAAALDGILVKYPLLGIMKEAKALYAARK